MLKKICIDNCSNYRHWLLTFDWSLIKILKYYVTHHLYRFIYTAAIFSLKQTIQIFQLVDSIWNQFKTRKQQQCVGGSSVAVNPRTLNWKVVAIKRGPRYATLFLQNKFNDPIRIIEATVKLSLTFNSYSHSVESYLFVLKVDGGGEGGNKRTEECTHLKQK